MAPRSRLLSFGSALTLVIAGLVCVAAFDGLLAEVLAIALLSVGLGGAVLLAFLEVGLSEDRERARDAQRRMGMAQPRHDDRRRLSLRRRPRRPT